MIEELKFKKTALQKIKDFIFFPLRIFFEHETVRKLGLTSLQDERFNACLPFLKGDVLDIGCGVGNKFIKRIGRGVGLDSYPWAGVDIVASAEQTPFEDKKFDIVTIIGTLSYIKNRDLALREIKRVLKDDGLLLILENHPIMNRIRFPLIWWWYPYKEIPDVKNLTKSNMEALLKKNSLKLKKIVKYVYGLSRMYVVSK
jgi:SAM-dependent methyltransferase